MKISTALAALLALGGCSGPLSHLRLETFTEAQRRAMMTVTFPSLDRADGVVQGWRTGNPDVGAIRHLVFGLHGIPPEAADLVATDRPVGIAISRADLPDPAGPVASQVNALSFALKNPQAARAWISKVGQIDLSSDDFFRAQRTDGLEVGQGVFRKRVVVATGTLWFHVDRDEVIVSDTDLGLQIAGPAARAARRLGGHDVVMTVHPQVWAPGQAKALAHRLAGLLGYLRLGRETRPEAETRAGAMLKAVDALFYLRAISAGDLASVGLDLGPAGASLEVRARGGLAVQPVTPVLDRALLTDRPAAVLGAMDCRRRILARQRNLIAAWKATGGPGVDELARLVDVQEQTLDGTCSFAVHTHNEVWATEASYPLRAGASGDTLTEALTAAIRSGGLPNLASAADDLPTAKLSFVKKDDGVLSLDRLLGGVQSAETRHAAALHGGLVLHDRYAIRGSRLLSLSGPRADERLDRLAGAAPGNAALPVELQSALANGRGKGGFLFVDLTSLWTPYLKAAQAVSSPLAELVAKRPALIKERRPLVVTIEPTADLDATVTMPPRTFEFLMVWGVHTLVR